MEEVPDLQGETDDRAQLVIAAALVLLLVAGLAWGLLALRGRQPTQVAGPSQPPAVDAAAPAPGVPAGPVPTDPATVLRLCRDEIAAGEAAAVSGQELVEQWRDHVGTQTALDGRVIGPEVAGQRWAQTQAAGPGAQNGYRQSVENYRNQYGRCARTTRLEGTRREQARVCRDRSAAVKALIDADEAIASRWQSHLDEMSGRVHQGLDAAHLTAFRAQMATAPADLAAHARAKARLTASPACRV